MRPLMGLGLTHEPLEIMFTENAVIIGIIAVNLPFMVLSLQSVIEGIDRAVEEAAHQPGRAAVAHVPPRDPAARLPGVLAGTILTFILAMNAYATPFLLGGPMFKMMAPMIYNEFAGLDELAVRRALSLRPDDGDPALDRHFELGGAAPLPALSPQPR